MNMILETEQRQLQAKNQALQTSVQQLHVANRFKLLVLRAAVAVNAVSLGLGVWSVIDREQPGVSEAALGFGVISMGISLFGLFRHTNAQTTMDMGLEYANELHADIP